MTRSLKTKAEKRVHPRLPHKLSIRVAVDGYDFASSTQNVSSVGAYCRINKYMPPFTKVMVNLKLPIMTNEGKKDCSFECKGVVVRTEDEKEGGFNIAIFFHQITQAQRKVILQYIDQFLPQETPSAQQRI